MVVPAPFAAALVVVQIAAHGPVPPVPPVPLDSLVDVALERNLQLLASRTEEAGARSNVLGALAAFDHGLSVGMTRNDQEARLPGQASQLEDAYSLGVDYSKRMPFSGEASLSVRSERQTLSPFDSTSAPIPTSPFFTTTTRLTYRQPLLRGFGPGPAFAAVESARQAERSTRLEIRRDAAETIARVEKAYWSLLAAQSLVRVAERSVALADSIARRNRELLELEMVTALDVATAERALAQRRTALVDSRRRRRDAMESLIYLVYGEDAARLLEHPDFEVRADSSSRRRADLSPLDAMERTALDARADVRGARHRLEAQQALQRRARNSLLPEVDLIGTVGTGGSGGSFGPLRFDGAFGTDQTRWSFGIEMSYPLANRQARAADMLQGSLVRRRRWELASVAAEVSREVSAARRGVVMGQDRLETARRAQDLARGEFDAAIDAQRQGVITTFQLLEIEEELLRARQVTAQALLEYLSAITDMELSLGRITEDYSLPGWLARP